jgi:heme O synthase-like polyprenyltransferase
MRELDDIPVFPVITTNVHTHNQSVPFAYITFILSLLPVSVRLDHHQVVIVNKYIGARSSVVVKAQLEGRGFDNQ